MEGPRLDRLVESKDSPFRPQCEEFVWSTSVWRLPGGRLPSLPRIRGADAEDAHERFGRGGPEERYLSTMAEIRS